MRPLFTFTEEHKVRSTTCPDCLGDLPKLILKHTDWEYSCKETDKGCLLKPTFRHMPYRNSFVPEIDIVVSHNDTQTNLSMRGRPVLFLRIFMAIWFGILIPISALVLLSALVSGIENILELIIPLAMCVFGYLLCKIGTKATFKSVVKAIKEELK